MTEHISIAKTTLEALLEVYQRLGEEEFRKTQPAAFLVAHHQRNGAELGDEITTFEWNHPLNFSPSSSGIEVYPLWKAQKITIGRALTNDIVLNLPKVSKNHALLRFSDEGYQIKDHGSRNGTKVNGRQLASGEWAHLQSGNLVAFFDVVFVYANLDDLILRLTYFEQSETKKPAFGESGPSTK